jgi:hypothetical protein
MSKKRSLTYEQILQYIMAGGDLETLQKETNVSQRQLLEVLVRNPSLVQAYQSEAQQEAAGLDWFNPEMNYSEDFVENPNPYTEQYARMEPAARQFAFDYFRDYATAGGNPIRVAELDKKYDDPTIFETQYGIPADARFLLIDKVKEDAPKWFASELETSRANQEQRYKDFQEQRKSLDIQAGESPTMAALRKSTGFGELALLPSADLTFGEVARKRAAEKYVSQRQKKIESMPATRVDAFMGSKQDTADLQRSSAATEKSKELFEKAFLETVKKKAGKNATPYSEAVKKILPVIATRLNIQG